MRGDGRDAERRAHVVRRGVGQGGDVADGQHDLLLRRAAGPGVLGEHRPDPVADREAGDVGADRVDHAGAVLAGHDLGEGQLAHAAGAELPVRGVDPGADDADADLARSGLRGLTLDELEDRGVTALGVDDGAHQRSPSVG